MLKNYFDFKRVDFNNLLLATQDTLIMTFISMIFVIIFGFILGLLLFKLSRIKKNLIANLIYNLLSIISNIFRSTPYIILIILLMDFSRAIMGTGIGALAAIPSLIISATPFFARLVELAFREVNLGVLEAADSMGANQFQKLFKFLIPESLPALISAITLTTVTMIGFTAMAGIIGGGGLGGLAYQEGFSRNNNTLTLLATILILILVFIIQAIGDFFVRLVDKR